jgi:hypothetical protein
MKLNRRKLRKLILKEFRDTFGLDFDFGAGAGGGQLPPVIPPRRGGGGGGDDGNGGGWDPRRDPNPGRCSSGNPHYDRIYDQVFRTFGAWVEDNYSDFQLYLDYILSLGVEMDELSDHFMEFFELLMTAIADYACAFNITDLTLIYRNPVPAIRYF